MPSSPGSIGARVRACGGAIVALAEPTPAAGLGRAAPRG